MLGMFSVINGRRMGVREAFADVDACYGATDHGTTYGVPARARSRKFLVLVSARLRADRVGCE
ncbi:hypothetical protein B0T44_19175 [Nocardia donostiensis]|uniref:Uncharacterized protein n=1 Tax=Nocardia donostiensis TaxID=1538463 RepID=A0A1W0B7L8_9NOCA|nr:hypothetical protein B0T46_24480 [Nocardia donostiensis]OQS12470.1 hypothetical protein B0T36_24785 [Nocardia donostiensis]OQS18513.1 hypothetical protein B0T44_19175 [Nocardia donostiensis]